MLMFDTMDRFRVQVLLQGGRHTQAEIGELVGMSERNVRRVAKEKPVESLEEKPEKASIGRPSKTAPFRDDVEKMLEEQEGIMSLEILCPSGEHAQAEKS